MVGIAGGAPNKEHDIRLGDVVISTPGRGTGGVYYYTLGRNKQNQVLEPTKSLNSPPDALLYATQQLNTRHKLSGHHIEETIERLKSNSRLEKDLRKPGSDVLFQPWYLHSDQDIDCEQLGCFSHERVVQRPERDSKDDIPAIHYGIVASGEQLMMNAEERDRLSAEKGLLCFEMEAAGLMDLLPSLVIRGICDYSDLHKNYDWQGYAAAAAAAYAKELLELLAPFGAPVSDVDTRAISLWLSSFGHLQQQQLELAEAWKGTCNSFLSCPEFLDWKEREQRILYCNGVPGCGKTVRCSVAMDSIRRSSDPSSVGVFIIYCKSARPETSSLEHIAFGLISQLLQTNPRVLNANLKSLHREHYQRNLKPTFEEATEILNTGLGAFKEVFIALDGLDELESAKKGISTEDYRRMAVKFLTNLKCNPQVLVTSRSIPSIDALFLIQASMLVPAPPSHLQAVS
ncbi:hypothetical protein MMC10_009446 [Thelotrema lepadinum]|nr:hypothetical protein [Thelotrema lepadinum]